jgi:hypothetical protein
LCDALSCEKKNTASSASHATKNSRMSSPHAVVFREIPGFGVKAFADLRPRGVMGSWMDALVATASCHRMVADSVGTMYLVDVQNERSLDAVDIVWSPWAFNGGPTICDDPLLDFGGTLSLNKRRKVTFPDAILEVSTISDLDLRTALHTTSHKGTQVGQKGGLVFALADRYCCEPCCVHLRSQLTPGVPDCLTSTLTPLEDFCPPRTCEVCPNILLAALRAHNRSYLVNTKYAAFRKCWTLSSWESFVLDAFDGYDACPFAASMSPLRSAWMAAAARSCLRRSKVCTFA